MENSWEAKVRITLQRITLIRVRKNESYIEYRKTNSKTAKKRENALQRHKKPKTKAKPVIITLLAVLRDSWTIVKGERATNRGI